jgi:C_GCAxxG_C_C family probable redox protein
MIDIRPKPSEDPGRENRIKESPMSSNRRAFLKLSCAGLGFLAASELHPFQDQPGAAEGSMAEWTGGHLAQGYWSADSLLLSSLKYMKRSEEIVAAATGFGGGMGRKDLCGYVTGGVMAIGLFCGAAKGSDKAARQKCLRLTKEYLEWWAQASPLRCGEIKPPCDYKLMGARASDYLQKMFERETAKG